MTGSSERRNENSISTKTKRIEKKRKGEEKKRTNLFCLA
jgi:hypothetical protein